MTKTILIVGASRDCWVLIGCAINNGWKVSHAHLFEDVSTALESTRVDLVLISRSSLQADWEQIVGEIWRANEDTPFLTLPANGGPDWLVNGLIGAGLSGKGSGVQSAPVEGPLRDLCEQLVCHSATPCLTGLPSHITAGIKRATDFIDAHYHEPINLADAAKVACYSRCHFCKVFKEQIGISFVSYLSRVRIQHAAALLVRSNKPITTIAYDVGFNDLSHFERVFRAIQNQSPSQFRRNAKDSHHEYQYPPSLTRHAVA